MRSCQGITTKRQEKPHYYGHTSLGQGVPVQCEGHYVCAEEEDYQDEDSPGDSSFPQVSVMC